MADALRKFDAIQGSADRKVTDPWDLEACSILLSSSGVCSAGGLPPEWSAGPTDHLSLESQAEVCSPLLKGVLETAVEENLTTCGCIAFLDTKWQP